MIDLVKRFFGKREEDRGSEAERIRVVELIWEIAYVDGSLGKHEDYFLHKLANLLRLTHRQLIDAKLRVKGSRTKGHKHYS